MSSELSLNQRALLTALCDEGAALHYLRPSDTRHYGHTISINGVPRKYDQHHWNTVEACIRRGWIESHHSEDNHSRILTFWTITDAGREALNRE